MALSTAEMDLEAVEFLPSREVMCGGCGGGGYQDDCCSGVSVDVNIDINVGLCL